MSVHEWNGSAWEQKGNDIDGESGSDLSGWSTAISSDGNILAIGATGNDANGNTSGHVRIYAWNGTAWTQRGNDLDGENTADYSGEAIALSSDGNIVAIGAYLNDGNGSDSGHVRVYAWNGTAWTQRGNDIDGESVSDLSGESVALSNDGSVLAIGATANDGNGTSSGHVRVYAWNALRGHNEAPILTASRAQI